MKKTNINNRTVIDEGKINHLLSRSVDTIYPSKEALKKELLSGRRLTVYAGTDATGSSLHIGHSMNFMLLKRFHELGHKVIVLVGDFTAMIGDPADRSAVRTMLTKEEVIENVKTFKEQIAKVLPLDDKENPIEFLFNSQWLGTLSFEDLVNLASNFTVQQMIERDTFEKRIKDEQPLYVHEFFYPLMQGYDSVAMEVDVEIGGTDQTFNMLAGRTLVKRYLDKEKFVITHPLLENPKTGEILMSKSAGTGIMLDDSPEDMFGKTMALPDEGIMVCFRHCTEYDEEELKNLQKDLENGANPRDLKAKLGFEIVKIYYGEEPAKNARTHFENTFVKGSMSESAPEAVVPKGSALVDVLLKESLVSSKSAFRRLVEQGAVRTFKGGTEETIQDDTYSVEKDLDLKIGKKRFLKIIVK